VDVGGVGYRLLVAPRTAAELQVGQERSFAVHTHVRESAITLYGFVSAEERTVFELLLGAHGVGPGLALAILHVHEPAELAQVIATTGLPPGYSGTTMPALAVCASATTPPPASTSPVSVPYTAPTESDAAMPSGTATDPLGSGLVPSGYTQMSATNLGSALAGEALGVIHTYTYSGGQTVTVIQPASGNATVIPQGQVTSTLRGLGLTQSQITQLEQQGALG